MKKWSYRALFMLCLYLGMTQTIDFFYQKFYETHPYLTIIGPVKMADGIARQTPEIADHLYDKVNLNIFADFVIKTDLSKKIRSILKRPKVRGNVILYEDVLFIPKHTDARRFFKKKKDENELRIAYSMIESSQVADEWVGILNEYFDAVVVPDPYLVSVYQTSGVEIPVFMIPLGLDFHDLLNEPLKREKKTPFVFATYGTYIDRKNHAMLIKAFNKAFGNRKDVFLLMNGREGDEKPQQKILEILDSLHIENVCFSRILLDRKAYIQNMKQVDCYVALSKGEGFSIQPREAMALGIPTILTDNTAHTTLCKTGLVKSVVSNIKEPAYLCEDIYVGERFQCKEEDVVEALLDVYHNYDAYVAKAEKMRKFSAHYDYANQQIQKLFQTLLIPKQVELGLEDRIEPDLVITTSQALIDKYNKVSNSPRKDLPSVEVFNKASFFHKIYILWHFLGTN